MQAPKLPDAFIPSALVVEGVAEFFGIPVADLRGERRSTSLSCARQLAALLMLEHSICSQVEVGAALGRRSETAGRDIIEAAQLRLKQDERFAPLVEQARKRLVERGGHV